MEKQGFLGKGVKFPLTANPATGRFLMSSDQTSVKESIYIILMTQKTERFARPDFGSNLMSYTFMDTSVTRLNMLSRELKQTILSQEPRVSQVDIRMEPRMETGCLLIYLDYFIAGSNTRENMVFPFYLYTQAEGEVDGTLE